MALSCIGIAINTQSIIKKMPQHKVASAVKEIARLKAEVKEETVLQDGSGIIEAALTGDHEGLIADLAREMKEFQMDNDERVLKGARAGEKLGKGLMEHI